MPHSFHFSVFEMRGFELQRPDAIGAGQMKKNTPAALNEILRTREIGRDPKIQNPDKITSDSGAIDEQTSSFVGVVI